MDPAGGSEAIIIATTSANGSTGTTAIQLLIHQGTVIGGPIVQANLTQSITAANFTVITVTVLDASPTTNLSYLVSAITTGTTVVPSSVKNTIIAFQVAD
jgi:hypothetical protein